MGRHKPEQARLPMRLPETEWEKEQRRRGAPAEVQMVRQRNIARAARAHAAQLADERRPLPADVLAAIGNPLRRVHK